MEKEIKVGFFEEGPGEKSFMRLAGIILLGLAGFLIVAHTMNNTEIPLDITLMLIGGALTGKLIQKSQEIKE